jgi:hypothetical protein
MRAILHFFICCAALLGSSDGFRFLVSKESQRLRSTASSASDLSWQRKLDEILDIDTSCEKRREIAADLIGERSKIAQDVKKAVDQRDFKVLAPPSLRFGKAVEGLQAFQRQLINDIIPGTLKYIVMYNYNVILNDI